MERFVGRLLREEQGVDVFASVYNNTRCPQGQRLAWHLLWPFPCRRKGPGRTRMTLVGVLERSRIVLLDGIENAY